MNPSEVTTPLKSDDNERVTKVILNYCQTFFNCRQYNLIAPNILKHFFDYKEAKLVKGTTKGDPKYYVEFSAFDAVLGRLRRKRIYTINSIKNLEQREIAGERLVTEINELLKNGYHFNDVKKKEIDSKLLEIKTAKYYTLESGLNYALKIKKAEIAVKSYANYKHSKNYILKFADYQSLRHSNIKNIPNEFPYLFLDYLRDIQKLQGQTINAIISQCKGLYRLLSEREIVGENIFKKIRKQKEIVTSQNQAYSPEQIEKIKNRLIDRDPLLWDFCQFIFYSFMRPNEIRQITKSNIDLKKNIIYLSAEKSKTKRERYIHINKAFKKVIENMEIDNLKTEFLLFNINNETRTKPIGTNTFMTRYRKHLDILEIPKNYTLYSWKHTGNVTAYKNGVDIYSLMKQNGHTSIDTTMKYLKSLGLVMDQELLLKFDSLKI